MNLTDQARQLTHRVVQNNLWRQRQCVNLIPSENTPSVLVKMMEISDPAGRYAEHRTMKGTEVYFYQGIDFIRDIEEAACAEMCKYFDCSNAEMRAISGQMANEVVFKAVTNFLNRDREEGQAWQRIASVMNNDLTKGGHLSSQPMGALYNYVAFREDGKENVTNFPIRNDNLYKIDTDALGNLLVDAKPRLIIFGKSMFIYPEPVRFTYDIVKDWDDRPIIMYDMAHVLGLYGAFQRPFQEGADVITGSTHKTFFGPQRGVIASSIEKKTRLSKLWLDIKSRVFPGSTSNHHLGTLLGLLMAGYEMNAFKDKYQPQVIKNAKAFARALKSVGLDVQGDPADDFTETHQVLLRVSEHGTGMDIARRLEENNIICNYQALPDDESFLDSSGLRLGTSEMTRFGMTETDYGPLAGLMADCIIRNKAVKEEVTSLRQRFQVMKFCVPTAEAVPMAAQILESAMPNSDYGKAFVDNLSKLI